MLGLSKIRSRIKNSGTECRFANGDLSFCVVTKPVRSTMGRSAALLLFLSSALISVTSNAADPLILREIKPTGSVTSIQVPANYPHNVVSFYAISKGNQSQLADFMMSAPEGATVAVKEIVQGRTVAASLASTRNWVALKFVTSGKEVAALRAPANRVSSSSTTTTTLPSVTSPQNPTNASDPCGQFTPDVYASFRATVQMYLGVTLSDAQLCQMFKTGESPIQPNPGSSGNGGSGSGSNFYGGYSGSSVTSKVLIRKDSCGQKGTARYLVRFDVNISRVPADKRAEGFTIETGLRALDYKGSRASSLKPTSDGKYAPQPLFLMASVGGTQKLNIVKWAGSGRIASVASRKTEDYVYWRGHVLTRTPAGRLLTGGRGTVELTNGEQTYSLCFALSRTRQRLAGYSD